MTSTTTDERPILGYACGKTGEVVWDGVETFAACLQCIPIRTLPNARAMLAAREGEPDAVRLFRNPDTRSWNHADGVLQWIDVLTARLAEMTRELDAVRSDADSMAAAAQSYRLEGDTLRAQIERVKNGIRGLDKTIAAHEEISPSTAEGR